MYEDGVDGWWVRHKVVEGCMEWQEIKGKAAAGSLEMCVGDIEIVIRCLMCAA